MFAMIVLMLMPVVGLLFFVTLPLGTAVPLYVAGVVMSLLIHRVMLRTARQPVLTGRGGLLGGTAEVVRWNGDRGTVRCHDELWNARGVDGRRPEPGDSVVVTAVEGLALAVAGPSSKIAPLRGSGDRRRDARPRAATRFDRLAPVYDILDAPMDWLGGEARRRRVLAPATGRVLEVGMGTGRNLDLYPDGVGLVGVDVSPRMLARARARSRRRDLPVTLVLGDAERLPFADGSFDTVAATCVFCSVDDPAKGLAEVRRVVRDDGQVLLLEHVRPTNPVLGALADGISRVTRLIGPEVNRRTVEMARHAGIEPSTVRRHGVWREVAARPAPPSSRTPQR